MRWGLSRSLKIRGKHESKFTGSGATCRTLREEKDKINDQLGLKGVELDTITLVHTQYQRATEVFRKEKDEAIAMHYQDRHVAEGEDGKEGFDENGKLCRKCGKICGSIVFLYLTGGSF